MACPNCQWRNSAEQKLCTRCGLFLLQPQLRWQQCSFDRRLGAYLLDFPLFIFTLGIGWFIWNIVVMTGGQNPDKQLLGVYIVNEQGEPIGFWHHALLRAFVGQVVLGGITFGVYSLLDYLWPLWNRHGQALHDKVAGTYVVKRMGASAAGSVRASREAKSDVWTEV